MGSNHHELFDATCVQAPSPPTQNVHDMKLPVELWLEVLWYMAPPSIRAFTITCSTFRWLAQPFLFKFFVVHLHTPTPKSTTIRRDNHPAGAVSRLAVFSAPHLMIAMTEMQLVPSSPLSDHLHEQGPLSPLSANTHLVNTIFAALPSLINLRRLVCHDVVFTKSHLLALSRLPHLKDLELRSCITSCTPRDFPDFSLVALESLVFDYPYNSEDYFRNSRFLALFLQARNLNRIFAGPANDILSAIIETPPPQSLSILEMPVSCVASPLFIETLVRCANVQELSLYMAIGNVHLPPLEYLPPDILPNLRSYRGPRTYAPWFMRDRDVTNVDFSLPAQPNHLRTTLTDLTNALECLSCKVNSLDGALLKTIHTTFPSLKHLAISGAEVDIDCLSSVLAIAKVHRGLRSIQISVHTGVPRLTDSWGVTVAKMFLALLLRAYPVLERAKLVYQPQVAVVWNRPREKKLKLVVDAWDLRFESGRSR